MRDFKYSLAAFIGARGLFHHYWLLYESCYVALHTEGGW